MATHCMLAKQSILLSVAVVHPRFLTRIDEGATFQQKQVSSRYHACV